MPNACAQRTFTRLLKALPPELQNRVDEHGQPRAAQRSLFGYTLAAAALARLVGPGGARLARDSRGKPYAPGLPCVHISIAHSGDWVVCALSRPHPVGIDIERIRTIDPRLPARAFHPAEAAWLQELPPAARLDAFFQVWTAKESYAKALGLGLALDPKTYWVDPDRRTVQRDEPGSEPSADPASPWHWRTRLVAGCYRLSLCTPLAEVESFALVDPQLLIANT